MNKQEKQELLELVQEDCKQVINYLNTHNIKVKDNKVAMLFSDGEVDEAYLNNIHFTNLWQLQYEPSLVKVEFIIERPNESHMDITGTLELLLDKIVGRNLHVDLNNTLDTSTTW